MAVKFVTDDGVTHDTLEDAERYSVALQAAKEAEAEIEAFIASHEPKSKAVATRMRRAIIGWEMHRRSGTSMIPEANEAVAVPAAA